MKEVYLTYETNYWSEFIEVFKSKEDAENYICEKAKRHMINRDDLFIHEGRDTKGRLHLTIGYKNDDEEDYMKFYVIEKEVH